MRINGHTLKNDDENEGDHHGRLESASGNHDAAKPFLWEDAQIEEKDGQLEAEDYCCIAGFCNHGPDDEGAWVGNSNEMSTHAEVDEDECNGHIEDEDDLEDMINL